MPDKEPKWTPMKALGRAQKSVDELGLPKFKGLEPVKDMVFPDFATCDDAQLTASLNMFAAYKATQEIEVANIEASVGAHDAAFNEGYKMALYRTSSEYEETGRKKPTQDELRGEILTKFGSLREQKYDLIEQQATLEKAKGLLKAYETTWNTISRIMTIRSSGQRV